MKCLKAFAVELIAPEPKVIYDEVSKTEILSGFRTLGIEWNDKEDTFTYSYNTPDEKTWTKRKMLKVMASLYDPL